MPTTLDITPSPRVLRMLGQIDFAPWQCLAELIDNSIDAFLDQRKAGQLLGNPRITIQLPTNSELDQGQGVLIIEDNGSGMTLANLQSAVRAGYSGNDPVEKMGLFGMGFNISTARLGRKTEVWTTTVDAGEWTGIVIDFDDLERQKTFHAPLQIVPKTQAELDVGAHGTRIRVSRLEPERIRSLTWGAGKAKTRNRLGKIYGRVMTDMDITISYDGDRIKPWRHCVWNPTRTVQTAEFGNVPARIEIDEKLPPRRFCTTCWVWLTDIDQSCSSCGHTENVIQRTRTLKGWIGVQRYFDKNHFGFDLIRNGRVIEELDKSFFTFKDANGEEIFEYPRDAMHWGGRLVGELEIDFVRVSHQKDSFDKLDPEWKHVVSIVRGNSPIQPKIAQRMGLPVNTSPLARLFAGYRKGIAGLKDLVPGDAAGVGLNSGVVLDYKERFYAGEKEYQDDNKWYDLVLQAERANRGDTSGAEEAGGDIPLTPPPEEKKNATDGTSDGVEEPPTPPYSTTLPPSPPEKDLQLSQKYELDFLPGSPAIAVTAYRHTASPHGPAYTIQPSGYTATFDYFPKASFFEESLQTPVDCLIVDLAQHFLALSASSPREFPVSQIAHEIRRKYFPHTLTDASIASDEADAVLIEIREHYDRELATQAPIDVSSLEPRLVEMVRKRAFGAESATEEQVTKSLSGGTFARYLDNRFTIFLVERWPGVALDGKFFSLPYEEIDPTLRKDALAGVSQALLDVHWLADEGSSSVSKDSAWRLRFARALASLRLVQSWRV